MNQLLAQNNTNTNTKPNNQTNAPANTNTNTPGNTNQSQSVTIPKIQDPFGGKSLSGVATQAINILLALIVIAAVVVIIISGFHMIGSAGKPDVIAKAKSAIIWAIIGLLVAFMSFAIVQIIQNIL